MSVTVFTNPVLTVYPLLVLANMAFASVFIALLLFLTPQPIAEPLPLNN